MEQLITMRATPRTLQFLRFVAALTRKNQYQVLERLLRGEADRLLKKKGGSHLLPRDTVGSAS
jgi:hypothetical protein